MASKIKETDIGKIAIEHFKSLGFEIYQEVDCDSRGIDLVTVKDGYNYAFELKVSFNLQVLNQAYNNKYFCHYSSIIVPARRYTPEFYFAKDLCVDLGIGVYTCKMNQSFDRIQEMVAPYININAAGLLLFDNKKDMFEAGSQNGNRWTPFKETCENIKIYLKNNNGCAINDIVDNVKHHYASKASAKSGIVKRIKQGIIKDVKIENNKIFYCGNT